MRMTISFELVKLETEIEVSLLCTILNFILETNLFLDSKLEFSLQGKRSARNGFESFHFLIN
jgi:hypothetical protein